HSSLQLFEENAFVRRMLIDEDEPIRVFHQHIKSVEDTDDLKLLGSGVRGTNGLPAMPRVSDPSYRLLAIIRDEIWSRSKLDWPVRCRNAFGADRGRKLSFDHRWRRNFRHG